MPQALAVLSYTRKDDEFFGGYITAFRKMLENAVHVVSGEETFRIFQDIEGIVIGENWRKKLTDVIQESSFLMPMLSPLFFNSEPCMDEVREFLGHERTLKRDDLILSVYFLSSAKLEKEEVRSKDPIAMEFARRQMFDWRQKAKVPLQEPAAREAILELAGEIVAAIDRLGAPAVARTAGAPEEHAERSHSNLITDPRLGVGVGDNIKREELKPREILWVDDKPDNNLWERRALESYGMRFKLARDTDQAKQLLSDKREFAAVISDMGRPGDRKAGLTLLKWLREAGKRDTPYFIYTSERLAKRQSGAGQPQPQAITADPDTLVDAVVASLR